MKYRRMEAKDHAMLELTEAEREADAPGLRDLRAEGARRYHVVGRLRRPR
jgi:hypothetical protein